MVEPTPAPSTSPTAVQLLENIGHDVKTIAVDEISQVGHDLVGTIERVAAKIGVTVLCAVVAVIGLAMLCLTAAVALAPMIPQLWLRLLLMTLAYFALGAAAAAIIYRRAVVPSTPATPAHQEAP